MVAALHNREMIWTDSTSQVVAVSVGRKTGAELGQAAPARQSDPHPACPHYVGAVSVCSAALPKVLFQDHKLQDPECWCVQFWGYTKVLPNGALHLGTRMRLSTPTHPINHWDSYRLPFLLTPLSPEVLHSLCTETVGAKPAHLKM